jgi:hypothetical protein
MKIISIRQPWADLIVNGSKNIENRSWPTSYRGPVLIHASLNANRALCPKYRRDPDTVPRGGLARISASWSGLRMKTPRFGVGLSIKQFLIGLKLDWVSPSLA